MLIHTLFELNLNDQNGLNKKTIEGGLSALVVGYAFNEI
jgi:hypothetical protein